MTALRRRRRAVGAGLAWPRSSPRPDPSVRGPSPAHPRAARRGTRRRGRRPVEPSRCSDRVVRRRGQAVRERVGHREHGPGVLADALDSTVCAGPRTTGRGDAPVRAAARAGSGGRRAPTPPRAAPSRRPGRTRAGSPRRWAGRPPRRAGQHRGRHGGAEGAADRARHGVDAGGDADLGLLDGGDDEVRHGREGEGDAGTQQQTAERQVPPRVVQRGEQSEGRDVEQRADHEGRPEAEQHAEPPRERAGHELPYGAGGQQQARDRDRGAEAVRRGGRRLGDLRDEQEAGEHGQSGEQPGDVRGEHRAVAQHRQLDERLVDALLDRHPGPHQHQPAGQQRHVGR